MTMEHTFPPEAEAASPPDEACGACPGECLEACFNDAIVAVAGDRFQIQAERCAGCGACIPACEFGHIRTRQGVARIVFV